MLNVLYCTVHPRKERNNSPNVMADVQEKVGQVSASSSPDVMTVGQASALGSPNVTADFVDVG